MKKQIVIGSLIVLVIISMICGCIEPRTIYTEMYVDGEKCRAYPGQVKLCVPSEKVTVEVGDFFSPVGYCILNEGDFPVYVTVTYRKEGYEEDALIAQNNISVNGGYSGRIRCCQVIEDEWDCWEDSFTNPGTYSIEIAVYKNTEEDYGNLVTSKEVGVIVIE